MNIHRNAATAGLMMVVFTILLGVVYPLFVTGVSQSLFPGNANGQLIHRSGALVGSKLIGQQFAIPVINKQTGKPELDKNGNPVTTPDPRYFQTRPSATTPADNAAASSFSNLGPNNVATEQEISANVKAYLALNKPYDPELSTATVPVDAADSSASGIDPDISVANADIQGRRVAAVRRMAYARVLALVSRYTTPRQLGVFGEPSVNVLELNLALDRQAGGHR